MPIFNENFLILFTLACVSSLVKYKGHQNSKTLTIDEVSPKLTIDGKLANLINF